VSPDAIAQLEAERSLLRRRQKRQVAEQLAQAGNGELEDVGTAEQLLPRPDQTVSEGVPIEAEGAETVVPASDPKAVARSRRATARQEKRAAKQAARVLAALERRESRERKALAKAAARRR
jgi:hypothetical protein